MRALREVMRMYRDGELAVREVARLTGVARSTARDMISRFEKSGLAWPIPPETGGDELERCLYGAVGVKRGHRKMPEPDWSAVAREMKRKRVTLQVLWEEYIAEHPDGYRYSRFCDLFRGWEGWLPLVMRQKYGGGEKLFVDYAGDTVPVVVDRKTGEIRPAHLFVAVMGGSNLSFAHATRPLANGRLDRQPSTCWANSALPVWQRPLPILPSMTKPPASATLNGWRCCSITKQPGAMTTACHCACVRPDCATMSRPRTSIIAARAVSSAGSSRC